MDDFEQDLKTIEIEIQRFALRYDAFSKGNEKTLDHLAHIVNILEHIANKHTPKPKMVKVEFT
jgi:hypothetical protein